jgi:hypothetical protein
MSFFKFRPNHRFVDRNHLNQNLYFDCRFEE